MFSKEDFVVNIGPQHPSTHGVLRMRTSIDGENIRRIDPILGYIHRGIEKMNESLTYPQTLALTDRLDYLSAHQNRHALCMCIEQAAGIEISERAQYIRTIMDELQRIDSHLLFYSCLVMDMQRERDDSRHHGRNDRRTPDTELQRDRRCAGGYSS